MATDDLCVQRCPSHKRPPWGEPVRPRVFRVHPFGDLYSFPAPREQETAAWVVTRGAYLALTLVLPTPLLATAVPPWPESLLVPRRPDGCP